MPLAKDLAVDVCVIGAGIAGLTTAYLLAREGKAVAVLDDGPVGGGQTSLTTAHLSTAIDDRYTEMERLHGPEGARLAAESHGEAIRKIEEIIAFESIACEFQRLDGYLFAPDFSEESTRLIERELDATHRAGLTDVQFLRRAPLPGWETGPCLRFPRQGQFHPLHYLQGMAKGFQRLGGEIHTGTHVASIDEGPVIKATTTRGPVVHAASVVVATNSPINDWVALHTKQAPYMTYVIGLWVPRGVLDAALYWDTLDPYHYVRLQHGRANARDSDGLDLLIVGGEDHKTGQANDQAQRFTWLEEWARPRFPMTRQVAYRWSGQVMETIDGLAFIGRNPGGGDNVHVVTGDSGMGMTHGTIAGILLTDLILGRPNPWASLYDPARKTLRAAGEFLRENLNVAQQYGDWLTGGDVAEEKEIQAGSGALIRRGLTKVAVYRDETGSLHELSAACPHLGCLVSWNDVEKTWDCPCHGSRFDARGGVVNGPANQGLEPA